MILQGTTHYLADIHLNHVRTWCCILLLFFSSSHSNDAPTFQVGGPRKLFVRRFCCNNLLRLTLTLTVGDTVKGWNNIHCHLTQLNYENIRWPTLLPLYSFFNTSDFAHTYGYTQTHPRRMDSVNPITIRHKSTFSQINSSALSFT